MKLFSIDLRAFDGGESAAAPAAQGSGTAAGAEAGQQAGSQGAPGTGQKDGAPEAARPSFDDLIKGEYRQDFNDRVKAIIDRRLKTSNAELAAVRPIMALLQQRYGIGDGRDAAAAVRQALENDADYWAAAAKAEGMTPDGYRRMLRAESQSRQLQKLLSDEHTQQGARAYHRQLYAQAQAVKEQYPAFDVEAELAGNPQFVALVRNHVDMLTAYQVCHREEFLAAAQRQAENKAMEKVRENQARPFENGSGGVQPVRLGSDPSKWTREQLREVERRVQRGEKIVL